MSHPSPLGLSVEIEKAGGRRFRWDANDRDPRNRPRDIGFGTLRGDGFGTASVNLARRADTDYQDLGLLDTIRFIGHDGTIAYEGRVAATPRIVDEHHSITVEAVGWMSHARDRQFTEIYVDRDLNAWETASVQRRINTAGSFGLTDHAVDLDDSTGQLALRTAVKGAWAAAPGRPLSEAWYDAGSGLAVGSLYFAWKKNANVNAADANWEWKTFLSDDDVRTATDDTANLRAAGPATGTLTATTSSRRFAGVQIFYASVAAGQNNVEYLIDWTVLAVYGRHGLTKRGVEDATNAKGFFASDVIRDIAQRFAPRLDPSGVLDSDYPISQIAFREATDPWDAWARLNDFHFRELAVWEGPTLHWHSIDLSDFDWQIRLGEDGVQAELQGDSTDGFRNGVVVVYDDFAGGRTVLYPPDHAELRDDSEENPANQHGIQLWGEPLTIPYPTVQADALTIGSAALAETNLPKAPGRITVPGHIRDRQGNWQPAWRVRAGERIAITNHPNDRPRLVTDTRWDQESKRLDIQVERPSPRLDALFNRIASRRLIAGLG